MRTNWRSRLVVIIAAAIVGAGLPTPAHAQAPALNWEQESPAQSPPARTFAASAYDSRRDRVVIFGGSSNGAANLGDTWEWNGATWTNRAPAVSPPILAGAAMAYDTARGRSVLVGGSSPTGLSSDSWEWDGNSWTRRDLATSPPPMVWAAMVYDSTRGRMVLFGAFNSYGLWLSETWEFDGSAWTQAHPANYPSARYGTAMAFDSSRNRVVMFGGHDANVGGRLAETWEWDGTNWMQLTPTVSPYQRFWHSMAFDPQRNRTILFGGDHFQPYDLGETNDTWEWDGSHWTRDWTAAAPSVRAGQSMVYDSALGRMLLFGGFNAGVSPNTFAGDTWELGTGIVTPPGTADVSLSTTRLAYSSPVGVTTSPAALIVTSSGSGPLLISSISITGDFAISSSDCPIAPDPLAAGSVCVMLVTATPTAPGDRTGTLTFADNAPTGTQTVALTVHGVATPAITISVTPTAPETSLEYGDQAHVSATINGLGAPGSPLSGTLTLAVNGHQVGSTQTITTSGTTVSADVVLWVWNYVFGAGTYPVTATFRSYDPNYTSTSVTRLITVLPESVSLAYRGDYLVGSANAPQLKAVVDQRSTQSDVNFIDYGVDIVWVQFVISGSGTQPSVVYARVNNASDWSTTGLGVANASAPALLPGAYTVVTTLVDSTRPVASILVAGDEARVGLAASPANGAYVSGAGAIASDPSANAADARGYFAFEVEPAHGGQGNMMYSYRTRMDWPGLGTRDVEVWVTSTDVTSLADVKGGVAVAGHFSVTYVDALTGAKTSGITGGTYTLTASNGGTTAPDGFALVLRRSDGSVFHATAPIDSKGDAALVPVVLGGVIVHL